MRSQDCLEVQEMNIYFIQLTGSRFFTTLGNSRALILLMRHVMYAQHLGI